MFWVCVIAKSKTSVVCYWEPSKRFSFLRANMPVIWAYFGDYFCSKSSSVQDATHTDCRLCGHEIAESLQCINTHQSTTLTACQLVDLVCVYPSVFVCVYILNENISFVMKPNIFFSLSQPKLMAKDLLDLVASHFNLKEKEYFGISYVDETYVYPAHPMKY